MYEILEEKNLPHIERMQSNIGKVAALVDENNESSVLPGCSSSHSDMSDEVKSSKNEVKKEKQIQEKVHTCPRCNVGTLVQRKNRKTGTKFWGCSRFPKCKYTCEEL